MEAARAEVAELIGAQPGEIVFTSGGTESDNLALRGVVGEWMETRERSPLPHLVASSIEHHAVLHVMEDLERCGHSVTYLPVGAGGRVEARAVAAALRPDTALVSLMLANNETGVMQPVAEVAEVAHAARIPLHVDAIQAVGRMPVDVHALGCDLLGLSGHKFHAAPGIGALYVRRGTRLRPMLLGGHHERDRRAGSENVPGIVSLGAASRLARTDGAAVAERLGNLRDALEAGILAAVPDCGVVGAGEDRVPNTTNIFFDGVEGEALVIALDLQGFCVSTGAACSSGALEPSHVLLAMGFSRRRARSCVRFSLGRQNTETEVRALLEILPPTVERLRRIAVGAAANHRVRIA
ncbi:MAG TPA: cysteine desulfurase family protein [Candidatus Sulfopaludibacter sp.]|nr:cysteine desulfurase family protein [Candidatus Sulfopaludibacter sp.]